MPDFVICLNLILCRLFGEGAIKEVKMGGWIFSWDCRQLFYRGEVGLRVEGQGFVQGVTYMVPAGSYHCHSSNSMAPA